MGKQGIDYFIDEVIDPERSILSQHEDKHLLHLENFVTNRSCTDERIFFLNATSGFLAKLLGIKAQTITDDDAKLYLHSRPMTRTEAEEQRIKSRSANDIAKQ